MWLLSLVTFFSGLVEIFQIKMYNNVFTHFQKPIIVICEKYVVTFRISYLLTILSQGEEENF